MAFLFWNVEALIHVFVFRDGGWLSQLFPTDRNELWMRGLVCILFISFGIYAHGVTKMRGDTIGQRVDGRELKPQRTMTYMGILAAVVFWIVEAFIHTALFNEGQISQNMFPTDVNEIWMRTLISLMLIVVGVYADSSIMKPRKSELERLRASKRNWRPRWQGFSAASFPSAPTVKTFGRMTVRGSGLRPISRTAPIYGSLTESAKNVPGYYTRSINIGDDGHSIFREVYFQEFAR